MANQFDLTIITPEKTIYEGKAESLVLPCENGYLGILANHASLMANVVNGKITLIVDRNQEPLNFRVKTNGFVEARNNNVTLLLNESS